MSEIPMSSTSVRAVLTPFGKAGPLLALLLALPLCLAAQPSPDRAALSAAADLKRKGASAGKVATEVTRSYRQTAGQTAVILQEVGFSGEEGTRALVRDLKLDPGKAAVALREARYRSGDVASGLSRAGLGSDRVVAALGAGRYRVSEIVDAQRSVLRLDAKAAWADLKRSGLLKTSAEELLEPFLEANVRDAGGGAETHELLTTVGRDVLGFGSGVAATIKRVFRKVGLTLRDRLAALREIHDWTAAQALAWLSGETSLEDALELVEEEYGLDTQGLVEAVLGALDDAESQFDRLQAMQELILREQGQAREEVVEALDAAGVPRDEIAQALRQVYGQVSDVADLMVSAGVWSYERAAEWLLDQGTLAQKVAEWLASKGVPADQALDILADAGAGTVVAVKAVARTSFLTTRKVVSWLLGKGVGVAEVVEVVSDATGAAALEIAQELRDAGVPADQIWSAMVSVMDLTAGQLVELMSAMGYSIARITTALGDLFGMSPAEAGALITQILGG